MDQGDVPGALRSPSMPLRPISRGGIQRFHVVVRAAQICCTPGSLPICVYVRLLLHARDAADLSADELAVRYSAGRVSEPAIPGARRLSARKS